jgi:hypothetical protein
VAMGGPDDDQHRKEIIAGITPAQLSRRAIFEPGHRTNGGQKRRIVEGNARSYELSGSI